MFCAHCGATLAANVNFCSSCGKPVSVDSTLEHEAPRTFIVMPPPSFGGTRAMDWLLAVFLTFGSAMMLFGAPTGLGVVAILVMAVVIIGIPVVSAIALGNTDFGMFGMQVTITPERRRTLRKASFVLNCLLGVLGVGGLIACVATAQYGPMLAMIFYVVPPFLNIRALRALKKHELNFGN